MNDEYRYEGEDEDEDPHYRWNPENWPEPPTRRERVREKMSRWGHFLTGRNQSFLPKNIEPPF